MTYWPAPLGDHLLAEPDEPRTCPVCEYAECECVECDGCGAVGVLETFGEERLCDGCADGGQSEQSKPAA
jgi:hypothetical protein